MDIQALKQHLTSVMPILDANLEAAHTEYMAGDIAAGAFHYVRTRHQNALMVLARTDLDPRAAYLSCALIACDLRTGIKLPAFQNEEAAAQAEAWWQCYRDAGFTEVNDFFNSPQLPRPVVVEEPPSVCVKDFLERVGTTGVGKTQAFDTLTGGSSN